jgi:hypothetical protein
MPDIEGLLGRITRGELEQLRTLRPDGFLPGSLVSAIDRAAGGPGEGRGYYVAAKPAVRREFIAYVLRPDVAKAVAAPMPSAPGTAASGPAAAGAGLHDESSLTRLPRMPGRRGTVTPDVSTKETRMPDIHSMIRALSPEARARILESGPGAELHRGLRDAIDEAAGGPGEGRGYYVVDGHLDPEEQRRYVLRADVTEALFGQTAGRNQTAWAGLHV